MFKHSTPVPAAPPMLSRNPPTRPLDTREFDRAHALAARLRQELLALIAQVPRSGASSVSLARDLRLDRMLCHRVCSALECENDWIEMLLRLPGPDSLHKFVAAAGKKGAPKDLRDSATAATDQFQKLIWELGGSQTRINTRLKATRDRQALAAERGGDSRGDEARVMIFEGARKAMGAWADSMVQIGVIQPTDNPRVFTQQLVIGCRGLHADETLFPLLPTVRLSNPGEAATKPISLDLHGDNPAAENHITPLGILREFSSNPLPPIRTSMFNNREMLVVDLEGTPAEGVDLIFHKQTMSLNLDDAPQRTPALIHQGRTPSQHVTLDLFIHRSLPMTGAASVSAVYPWFLAKNDAHSAWQDALPGDLRLEMLGSGLDAAHNARWHRHRELCSHLLDRSGHDPSEFIGYRCQTSFPYWGASYVVSIDLTERR